MSSLLENIVAQGDMVAFVKMATSMVTCAKTIIRASIEGITSLSSSNVILKVESAMANSLVAMPY